MFRKKDHSDQFTIFFATDVHGSNVCFKKFIGAAKFYEADVLVLGGDVTGKMVVPIARQADGSHLTEFAGRETRLEGDNDVAKFQRLVADMGFYPALMSEEEFRELKAEPDRQ